MLNTIRLICFALAIAAPALAQGTIAGIYDITKPDGTPIAPGMTATVIVEPYGAGYVATVYIDVGGGPILVEAETAYLTPFGPNGSFTFVNLRGSTGQIDPNVGGGGGGPAGTYTSTMLTGANAGLQRLWTPL